MLRKVAILISVFPIVSACTVNANPAVQVSLQQASAIEASCTTIMGLRKGEFQYLACRDSLSNTAAGLIQGEAHLQAYDSCRNKGLAPGSAALATCMLDNEHSAPVQVASVVAAPEAVASPHDDLKFGSSYYSVTHEVQWRREQYSCAQLGLVPGSSAFLHCVASLDADLLPDLP